MCENSAIMDSPIAVRLPGPPGLVLHLNSDLHLILSTWAMLGSTPWRTPVVWLGPETSSPHPVWFWSAAGEGSCFTSWTNPVWWRPGPEEGSFLTSSTALFWCCSGGEVGSCLTSSSHWGWSVPGGAEGWCTTPAGPGCFFTGTE